MIYVYILLTIITIELTVITFCTITDYIKDYRVRNKTLRKDEFIRTRNERIRKSIKGKMNGI